MPNGHKKTGGSAHANRQRQIARQKEDEKRRQEKADWETKVKSLEDERQVLQGEVINLQGRINEYDFGGGAFVKKKDYEKMMKEKEDGIKARVSLQKKYEASIIKREELDAKLEKTHKEKVKAEAKVNGLKSNLKGIQASMGEMAYQYEDGAVAVNGETLVQCRLCRSKTKMKYTEDGTPIFEDGGRICRDPVCQRKVQWAKENDFPTSDLSAGWQEWEAPPDGDRKMDASKLRSRLQDITTDALIDEVVKRMPGSVVAEALRTPVRPAPHLNRDLAKFMKSLGRR
jgi:hypothetical protein